MNVKKYLTYAFAVLLMIGSFATVWYLMIASPWTKKNNTPPIKPTGSIRLSTQLPKTTTNLPQTSGWLISNSSTYRVTETSKKFPKLTPSRVRCPFSCVNVGGCECVVFET